MWGNQSSHTFLLGIKNDVQSLWKKILEASQKFNVELVYEEAILLLGTHQKELKSKTQMYLYTYAQHSIIHTRKKKHKEKFLRSWMNR